MTNHTSRDWMPLRATSELSVVLAIACVRVAQRPQLQVDARHHRLRRRAQPDQAVGFVERVKVVDDQPGAAIRAGHDPGPRVVAGFPEAGCGLLAR